MLQVLTGFIAGAAALTVGKAEAANPIDLFDDRAKKVCSSLGRCSSCLGVVGLVVWWHSKNPRK